MNKEITILVADDHPMLLKGLTDELTLNNYKVVASVSNGAKALELIFQYQPKIAILDISMPLLTGFEVIQKCKEKFLDTKFIILTSYKERAYILKAKKLNISGYLLKDEPFLEIKNCIQEVNSGGNYFSSSFKEVLDNEVSPDLKKIKFLSPSERTVVRLISQEKSTKEIAEILNISYRTVQKHRSNIIAKLDLSSDSDALSIWAQKNKELFNNL